MKFKIGDRVQVCDASKEHGLIGTVINIWPPKTPGNYDCIDVEYDLNQDAPSVSCVYSSLVLIPEPQKPKTRFIHLLGSK